MSGNPFFQSLIGGVLLLCACDTGRGGGVGNLIEPLDLARPLDAAPDLGPCGGCGGDTPWCDLKTKSCVACLTEVHCGAATICKTGRCVPGCSAMHNECGDAGSCDLDGGTCHGCRKDA